jgi:predicted RNA-binding protein associated with RNAse of E/G family
MKIYRKRYIPNEVVDISGDKVLLLTEDLMVTEWLPIKPRGDISYGKSYTFFKKGWKISKFLDANKNLICWYCDIIDYEISNDEYTLIDLLVDVKIYPNGEYEILDLDELDEAVSHGLISEDKKEEALDKMNELVEIIKNGNFPLEECK